MIEMDLLDRAATDIALGSSFTAGLQVLRTARSDPSLLHRLDRKALGRYHFILGRLGVEYREPFAAATLRKAGRLLLESGDHSLSAAAYLNATNGAAKTYAPAKAAESFTDAVRLVDELASRVQDGDMIANLSINFETCRCEWLGSVRGHERAAEKAFSEVIDRMDGVVPEYFCAAVTALAAESRSRKGGIDIVTEGYLSSLEALDATVPTNHFFNYMIRAKRAAISAHTGDLDGYRDHRAEALELARRGGFGLGPIADLERSISAGRARR